MTKDLTKSNKRKPENLPERLSIKPSNAGKKGKVAIKKSPLPAITPEELDHVRRNVLATVKDNIPNVKSVLKGDLRWTNQQVKLFQLMLNKVMPDLSASMHEHKHSGKAMKELTREELEDIVKAGREADRDEKSAGSVILEDDMPSQTAKDNAIELAVEEFKKNNE